MISRILIIYLLTILAPIAGKAEKLDLVFDLDSILVNYTHRNDLSKFDGLDHVSVGHDAYLISHAYQELFDYIRSTGSIRIFIFSSGTEDRNLELLEKIILSDGQSMLDVVSGVLSRDDLDLIENEGEKAQRKDLRKVSGDDLSHSILVEDIRQRAFPGQEPNLLWVPDSDFNFSSQYVAQEILSRIETPSPRSAQDFAAEYIRTQNRLVYVAGLLDLVLETAESLGITPSEALFQLQWKKNGAQFEFIDSLVSQPHVIRRGRQVLTKQNPQFKLRTLTQHETPEACGAILKALSKS